MVFICCSHVLFLLYPISWSFKCTYMVFMPLHVVFQRQYIPINFRRASFWWFITQYLFMYLGSLSVLICLSFFLLGSWDYLPSVYGFMWVFVFVFFRDSLNNISVSYAVLLTVLWTSGLKGQERCKWGNLLEHRKYTFGRILLWGRNICTRSSSQFQQLLCLVYLGWRNCIETLKSKSVCRSLTWRSLPVSLQPLSPWPDPKHRPLLVLLCRDVWAFPPLLPLRFPDQCFLLHHPSVHQAQVSLSIKVNTVPVLSPVHCSA